MASIRRLIIRGQPYYYLDEPTRVGNKVKHLRTYLGTKPPLPKGIATTGLSPDWVERLKRKARQPKQVARTNPVLPDGIFPVIYADPPWQYDFVQVSDWGIETHYDTLPIEQIKFYKDGEGTPIQDKIAKDAVLFLWATPPKLSEAMAVIEAWGFRYITQAVWVKNRLGMGYWWMQKHELLLLAKRGNFPAPKAGTRPPSIITAKWNGHSKKPPSVYRMIEQMCPAPKTANDKGYYLECFARGPKRKRWAGFGHEYGKV